MRWILALVLAVQVGFLNGQEISAAEWEQLVDRAQQGVLAAQRDLALRYYSGNGVEQDRLAAIHWQELAASQGDPEEQSVLAAMYADRGLGTTQEDAAQALKWLLLAAQQGHRRAMAQLGSLYDYGIGLPQDDSAAAGWFLKAIKEVPEAISYADGQMSFAPSPLSLSYEWRTRLRSRIGEMYETGEGLPQDSDEAQRWKTDEEYPPRDPQEQERKIFKMFVLLAVDGDVVTQYGLGRKFDLGEGSPQDPSEAVRWYRSAAEQGHGGAQCVLGSKYARGQIVDQDFVESYKWVLLAEAAGDAANEPYCEGIKERLGTRLGPNELEEAQRRAAAWKPKSWESLKPSTMTGMHYDLRYARLPNE